ncbi:MAG: UvrD-helicase domain-containing protein [Acidobacteria bacterium]|nr:UvrD-helicase domain-containing protein [Acidobacteriota bacterium]
MKLSPSQQAAVEAHEQDVCVVAGPGSGKTRVLIERFRWLVETEGLDPRRILAITFTDKAATEIKKRLVDSFAGRPELRSEIERAWVSTVHGFCARLLKENAIVAGADPEFAVLDQDQADAGLEEAAVGTLDLLLREDAERLRTLLSRLYVSSDPNSRQPDLAQALIAVYQAMRVAGQSPGDLRASTAAEFGAKLESTLGTVRGYLAGAGGGSEAHQRRVEALREWLGEAEALAAGAVTPEHFRVLSAFPCKLTGLKAGSPFYDLMKPLRDEAIPELKAGMIVAYNAPLYDLLLDAVRRIDAAWRGRKRELGALDFADLEEAAIRLLREEPALAGRVRENFDAILMDELQDTNPLQWTLVDLLRRPGRFFAVGDVNQSIFGFRHAEPAVYRRYRESVAAAGKTVHELRRNHRSRPEILEAVNAVFASAGGVEPHTLLPSDKFAPAGEPCAEILVGMGATSADATAIEAAWIARRLLEIKERLGVEYSDIAVLGRSLNALEPVRLALAAAGIPALVAGGRTFFETREVRDLRLWLGVLANSCDQVALAGLLRSPLVGIRDESLLRYFTQGEIEPADRERLEPMRALLDRLRPWRDSMSPDRLAAAALDASDYLATLSPHGRANVDKFLGLLRDLFSARPCPLSETLDELDRLREAANEAEAPPGESSNSVRLMSIHKSKGLEFRVVFVPALQRSTDSRRPVIVFDPAAGIGVRWRDPAGSKGIADSAFESFVEQLEEREKAEENRLLYVAMTRAEEYLVLSWAEYRKSAWTALVTAGLAGAPVLAVTEMPEALAAPGPAPDSVPEAILARPELDGQHDSTAAVTSIALFRSCPRRYFLGRYLGWAGSGTESQPSGSGHAGLDASEFGRQVHALLAGEAVADPQPEAAELAAGFARTPLGERLARATRVGKEDGFLLALDDVILRGEIDLWFEEGGELVLADYKTDRVTAAAGERLEPYRLQLRLYALALERMLGRLPDRVFLHLLRSGESVAVDCSPQLLEDARAAVAEFCRAQNSLRFPPREGKQCESCEFRQDWTGACPSRASFPARP